MPTTPMHTVSLERDQLMLNLRQALPDTITNPSLQRFTDTSPWLPHMPVPTTPMDTI